MKMNMQDLSRLIIDATYKPRFDDKSSYPLPNAQANLAGRTHYVDDETLRCFRARIVSARPMYDGLLFAVIESVAMDYENTKRGFRFVVFDIWGDVISRVKLDESWRTRDAASKALSKWYSGFDVESHYLERLRERSARLMEESARYEEAAVSIKAALLNIPQVA